MSASCHAFYTADSGMEDWLPDMDLNHDKQIQSLLCYRYTIGQSAHGDPTVSDRRVKRAH